MSSQDILQYIPQRPPFVMIDSIAKADGTVSETNFTIREGHLFVEEGKFTEPGLVENMAQTAAAGTGYSLMAQGKPVPVGFIGALKALNVLDMPAVGDTITTEVSFKTQVLNVHIVQGRVFNKGVEIANCELKIFLQES